MGLARVLSEIRIARDRQLKLNSDRISKDGESENSIVQTKACEMPPASATNLSSQRMNALPVKTEPPAGYVKPEGTVKVEQEVLTPVTTSCVTSQMADQGSNPITPPNLENEKGKILDEIADFDFKGKPLDPSKDTDNEKQDPSFDPKKSPKSGSRKNAKKLPWHDKLVLGGKMSGARDTRVRLNKTLGQWEAKIRLDPILPFMSLGFFATEDEAKEAATKRLKNRQTGLPQHDMGPKLPTTRSRTGRLKPKSPWGSPPTKIKLESPTRGGTRPVITRRKKRGRPRIRSSATERHPPLRVPLPAYGKGRQNRKVGANGQMIQQALSNFNLPCPANSYNRRMPPPNLGNLRGNPYESTVTQPKKKIKTESGLPSPISRPQYAPALRRQDTALRHFNVQEQMRAQIREAFSTKQKAESRLTMGKTLTDKKASLKHQAEQLDNSISSLFEALDKHEKTSSAEGKDSDSDNDVKDTKELMKQLVQRRDLVGKQQLVLEEESAKCSDEVWLREVLNKSNNQIENLRRKRYSFDGTTTIEFITKQMGWNPFQILPVDAQNYFISYLNGSVLKFECEFWSGGSKVVAENICKIIKECTDYSPDKMDNIYRNFLVYLQRD